MRDNTMIAELFDHTYKKWEVTENDTRTFDKVVVDFTMGCIEFETGALRQTLDTTNHLLTVLLADPLVHKDQKAYIQQRLDLNKKLLDTFTPQAGNEKSI